MASNDHASSVLTSIGQGLRVLFWTVSILASAGAGAFVATHLSAARGPGQQVAVAALGLVIVLVPYTIARGVSELTN
ncbi:MAG: hypothetical protein BRD55_08310 [Bacteroidetes bacterium SW_9_63_38]|nr:MAG: hypothetical protein BRD55_08310 [Bacteroidetes bacterium SW_9_63_38]